MWKITEGSYCLFLRDLIFLEMLNNVLKMSYQFQNEGFEPLDRSWRVFSLVMGNNTKVTCPVESAEQLQNPKSNLGCNRTCNLLVVKRQY